MLAVLANVHIGIKLLLLLDVGICPEHSKQNYETLCLHHQK